MATPSISPAGGTFKYAQSVTISDITSGAAIYYTLDGSAPTTSSTLYTAPITINADLGVNAIAVAGGITSAAANAVYTINTITGVISTVAGNGKSTYNGDGISAIEAGIDPSGVAVDSHGNIYVADSGNSRVRMINSSGKIATVAGNGTAGFGGDGQDATSAELDHPFNVALDASGNLYIADYFNNRVRKVTSDGVISTVAGTGTAGYSGDGGAATSANLFGPFDIALDSAGNLYIADSDNSRIREVNTSGIISTIAGNGQPGYSGDGGPAMEAELSSPQAVVIDSAGNLYITDNDNEVIRKVTPAGIISTISMGSYALDNPGGLAVDNIGHLLYVADTNNSRILVMTSDGSWSLCAGRPGDDGFGGDGGESDNALIDFPAAVSVDSIGNLYIADTLNNRVREVNFGIPGN